MKNEVLLWVDVETTGLDPHKCRLLEVAAIITDLKGNVISDDFSEVVKHEDFREARAEANDFVKAMHDATGLWDKLPEGMPLEELDAKLYAYLTTVAPEVRQARLAGSSCRLDLNFVEFYLPRTYGHLHYRSVDVSSLAYLAEEWSLVPGNYEKKKVHSALSDIRESLAEYRWIMEQLAAHKLEAEAS